MPSVAIQYGIFGGVHTGRRMQKQLKAAGYTVVSDVKTADIIIAHSAGCFWLPDPSQHQKLVLINPIYWPGRSVGDRGRQRLKSNWQFRQHGYRFQDWLARQLWGLYYAVFDARRTYRIFRYAPEFDLDTSLTDRTAVLVRNSNDDWLTPDLGELQSHHPNVRIVEIPGDHDDCMYHPKVYIDLLQSMH